MGRVVSLVVLVILIVVGLVLLVPSPISSTGWTPPPAPAMTGPLAPNERLRQAELLAQGQIKGPETVVVDAQGRLYAGLQNGHIVRFRPGGPVEDWVNTGGRPLGMAFDAQGNLVVCDAWKGLLSISPQGQVSVLATSADGRSFAFADDLAIASDGRIYFTDASYRWHQPDYKLDLMETRPYGRLLRYDPATGEVKVLMSGLYFANGVALSPGGRYLLVNETWRYRIWRYWLSGPKEGQKEIFADNLPGFPDGIDRDGAGRYWVALPTLRNGQLDAMHPYAWIKDLVAKLPEWLQPKPQAYGFAIVLDAQGHILASLQDTQGEHLQEVTAVTPHQGMLYFGSLHNDRIGRLPISAVPGLETDPHHD